MCGETIKKFVYYLFPAYLLSPRVSFSREYLPSVPQRLSRSAPPLERPCASLVRPCAQCSSRLSSCRVRSAHRSHPHPRVPLPLVPLRPLRSLHLILLMLLSSTALLPNRTHQPQPHTISHHSIIQQLKVLHSITCYRRFENWDKVGS